MYQYALVKMLHNPITKKFHPIFYLDSPLPGGIENAVNSKVLRYKSKGHHTTGFESRLDAVNSANELVSKLKDRSDTVTIELDEIDDLIWDEDEIPTDIQLRPFPNN